MTPPASSVSELVQVRMRHPEAVAEAAARAAADAPSSAAADG